MSLSSKTHEIDVIEEYVTTILIPITTAIIRLQRETKIYYGELLPTLLIVQNKLDALKTT